MMSADGICRKCNTPLLAGNRYAQSAFCRVCIGGRIASDYSAELARAKPARAPAPAPAPVPVPAPSPADIEKREADAHVARMRALDEQHTADSASTAKRNRGW